VSVTGLAGILVLALTRVPVGAGAWDGVRTQIEITMRLAEQDGTTWIEAMTETLERLERLCAPAEALHGG
jgi:hypothetical protein